jgi:hypothetical protein
MLTAGRLTVVLYLVGWMHRSGLGCADGRVIGERPFARVEEKEGIVDAAYTKPTTSYF